MKRLLLLVLLVGCAHRQPRPAPLDPDADQRRAAHRAEKRARVGAAIKAAADGYTPPHRTNCTGRVSGETFDMDCEDR